MCNSGKLQTRVREGGWGRERGGGGGGGSYDFYLICGVREWIRNWSRSPLKQGMACALCSSIEYALEDATSSL